jgi:hypothetical protein
MVTVYGHTGEGKISEHTKEATARPIYQPVEFDFAEYDDDGNETEWAPLIRKWQKDGVTVADACAALLLHLATLLPLFLITHSGGKACTVGFSSKGCIYGRSRENRRL